MNKSTAHLSILLAGLLAVAGVQAQTAPAAGSSDLPPKAGEASTQTRGVPNAATTNSPATEAPIVDKDQVRQDAHGQSNASVTTPVPGKAGEASTMVQGRPNAMLDQHNVARSRADVVNELMQRRGMYEAARRSAQAMGYTGAVSPQ
ncbi:MAG TPA: hypothetical protein VGE20_17555 [Ramlibacter sp.]